ncbi:polysaccharide pyruvyl transferase family protein [Virgibacillus sp. LDC-1]|uniref:polysaccharide pyruvyl transferase family protein n=1 Tax=Virgibacillus sp. LDC-1 TaxID=3039856 RepID=UPI0024DEA935|nr:polysaccharide pyruvyl transferase family protein [Virgibacillus sp. LDC-1]
MKKIMIYAYTQFNLGDDLFIKLLCERYPSVQFLLYAPKKYELLFKQCINLTVYPSDTPFEKGKRLLGRALKLPFSKPIALSKRCDGIVQIGGSLFIQRVGWKKELAMRRKMHIKEKPYYLLGANFGPYDDPAFYNAYKRLFAAYTDICFREEHSYRLFQALPNVRKADDIVFQLKPERIQSTTNNVFISVIKPSTRKEFAAYDEPYYEKIRDIALALIQEGYQITLTSFCAFEGDEDAVKQILNLIPAAKRSSISTHFYQHNMEETLHIIAQSCYVIATRFHAMILGWVYEKPVFPIVYSQKMIHVMEDAQYNGTFALLQQIATLDSREVTSSMETNTLSIQKQANSAPQHFQELDKLLLKTET